MKSSRLKFPIAVIAGVAVLILFFNAGQKFEWTGFGADQTKSRAVEFDSQRRLVKIVRTTTPQSGKTLWDILSLIGVPASLALLGWWLQVQQQRQSDVVLREEALKEFIDAIAALLIEKNLIAIATKVKAEEESQVKAEKERRAKHRATANALEVSEPDADPKAVVNEPSTSTTSEPPKVMVTDEQRELLAAATDVIQARTLSILRRLGDDAERKSAVIRFLGDSDVIEKVGLNLSGIDLRKINLRGANLRGLTLVGTNLDGADLTFANLRNANLEDANLNQAILRFANLNQAILERANLNKAKLNRAFLILANLERAKLHGAKLDGADLNSANFRFADLHGAKLGGAKLWDAKLPCANLVGADLSSAKLSGAKLSGADLRSANLSGAELKETNLKEANLSIAKGLTEAQLSEALLCSTTLPDEFQSLCDRDYEKLKSIF